jgi:hypothetical protein
MGTVGKPIYWDKEKKDNAINIILNEIMENGKSLREILNNADRKILPSNVTFCEWLSNDNELAKQYARATEIRAEVIFDDILGIADQNEHDTTVNDNGIEIVNNDVIQRSRLRIDARKWVLSKLNPKKFGDKTDITSGGEKIQSSPTTIQVEITRPNED